jgi:hypothetical protein
MSRKGGQKKPLSKATVALNEQLRRKRETRDLAEKFLIVCEDTKSAVHYFEALVSHFKISATSVQISHSDGHTQPIQVVETALRFKEIAEDEESGTEPFKHVWCVIDGDFGDKISNARHKADAHEIRLAVSTKCFEYWILLHFVENATPTEKCAGIIRVLKRHLPSYKKGKCEFHEIVKNVHDACDRASRLRKPGIERKELPEAQNPCSEVYELIKQLFKAN